MERQEVIKIQAAGSEADNPGKWSCNRMTEQGRCGEAPGDSGVEVLPSVNYQMGPRRESI